MPRSSSELSPDAVSSFPGIAWERGEKVRTDVDVHPAEAAVCLRWTSSSAEGHRFPRVETAAFALEGVNHAD